MGLFSETDQIRRIPSETFSQLNILSDGPKTSPLAKNRLRSWKRCLKTSDLIRDARPPSRLSQKVPRRRTGVVASSLFLIESGKRSSTVDTGKKLLKFAGCTLIAVLSIRETSF
ncbi:hypothetical protein ACVXZ4_07685 [Lacisediminihabitans sp. FW035]